MFTEEGEDGRKLSWPCLLLYGGHRVELALVWVFETELSGHNVKKELPFMEELYD